jgi:hypothetical protein
MADAAASVSNVVLDDEDRVICSLVCMSYFADASIQEIEEMRRQVQEMEQNLARENEAAELAAIAVKNGSIAAGSSSLDASKDANGQAQGGANSSSVSHDGQNPSENATDDDVDSRSIYVGNVGVEIV